MHGEIAHNINWIGNDEKNSMKIGGKKLVYTHLDFPLSPLTDLSQLPHAARLGEIVADNGGFWCAAAERVLLGEQP